MKVLTMGVIIIAILAVVFAGCTSQQQTSPATVTPVVTSQPVLPTTTAPPALPSDLAGNWQLTLMGIQGGSAVTVPTTAITLAFGSDVNVSGNGGCNNYFGPYALTGVTTTKGNGVTIGPLGSTKMYCSTTSQQESTYLAILQDTMAYVVDGTQLTLTDKSQNVLIFQRPSTIPKPTEGMLPA
jgi:heat shock protein HslJ